MVRISLAGIETFAQKSDQERHGVRRTLILISSLTAVLVAALVGLVVM